MVVYTRREGGPRLASAEVVSAKCDWNFLPPLLLPGVVRPARQVLHCQEEEAEGGERRGTPTFGDNQKLSHWVWQHKLEF